MLEYAISMWRRYSLWPDITVMHSGDESAGKTVDEMTADKVRSEPAQKSFFSDVMAVLSASDRVALSTETFLGSAGEFSAPQQCQDGQNGKAAAKFGNLGAGHPSSPGAVAGKCRMEKPNLICLTPVKNEAWILSRFLKCASLWADHIVVADQHSDDGSREIARSFEKVILVDNEDIDGIDENERRKILFEEARKFHGPRVLVALDADEVLTPNVLASSQWQAAINAPPGTSFGVKWANIRPNLQQYWTPPYHIRIGYVDDGAEYRCGKINAPRVHSSPDIPCRQLDDIVLMHYQYTDWERMESKHRWYKCWEKVNDPHRSAISIYRQYHHMYAIGPADLHLIPSWWFEDYQAIGIDMTTVVRDQTFHWERSTLQYMARYGPAFFSKLDVWDIDWTKVARTHNVPDANALGDPRTRLEMLIHHWLWSTQPRAAGPLVRILDRLLRLLSFNKW